MFCYVIGSVIIGDKYKEISESLGWNDYSINWLIGQ